MEGDSLNVPAGGMDGETLPRNKLEEAQKFLEPLQAKYGGYIHMVKPWKSFFMVSKPSGALWKVRLEKNLAHFQFNYAALFAMVFIGAIVMNPRCLVMLIGLAAAWFFFLRKNEDPEWVVEVGGVQLGKTQRWFGMTGISLFIIFIFVGQLIFSVAGMTGALVLAHGVSHPGADDEETDAMLDQI